MARPRKADTEQAATVRIENAFWKLLEHGQAEDITVRLISQESGTNDLAAKAFSNNMNTRASQILIGVLLNELNGEYYVERPTFDPDILIHSRRIMLCARSESSYLKGLVGDMLKQTWFDAFSIKEELLSETERLEISFIFSGLVAVLDSKEVKDSSLKMYELAQSELGKTIIAELKKISASQDLLE